MYVQKNENDEHSLIITLQNYMCINWYFAILFVD